MKNTTQNRQKGSNRYPISVFTRLRLWNRRSELHRLLAVLAASTPFSTTAVARSPAPRAQTMVPKTPDARTPTITAAIPDNAPIVCRGGISARSWQGRVVAIVTWAPESISGPGGSTKMLHSDVSGRRISSRRQDHHREEPTARIAHFSLPDGGIISTQPLRQLYSRI